MAYTTIDYRAMLMPNGKYNMNNNNDNVFQTANLLSTGLIDLLIN